MRARRNAPGTVKHPGYRQSIRTPKVRAITDKRFPWLDQEATDGLGDSRPDVPTIQTGRKSMSNNANPAVPLHNPLSIGQEALEATLSGRTAVMDDVEKKMAASLQDGQKHYLLLVGPPGAGKSHLLALGVYRLRRTAQELQKSEQVCIACLTGNSPPQVIRRTGARDPQSAGTRPTRGRGQDPRDRKADRPRPRTRTAHGSHGSARTLPGQNADPRMREPGPDPGELGSGRTEAMAERHPGRGKLRNPGDREQVARERDSIRQSVLRILHRPETTAHECQSRTEAARTAGAGPEERGPGVHAGEPQG